MIDNAVHDRKAKSGKFAHYEFFWVECWPCRWDSAHFIAITRVYAMSMKYLLTIGDITRAECREK